MADEVLDTLNGTDSTQADGPGPQPRQLTDQDRKVLSGLVSNMQKDNLSDDRIKAAVAEYFKQNNIAPVSVTPKMQQPDYRNIPQQKPLQETATSPVTQIQNKVGTNVSTDPAILENKKKYDAIKNGAISAIESPQWVKTIFPQKKPALTEGNLPTEAYQQIDTKGLEAYLDTRDDLDTQQRYWLRNQLINYAKQRQAQPYIDQRARENVEQLPAVKAAQQKANEQVIAGQIKPEDYDKTWQAELEKHPEISKDLQDAYNKAAQQYQQHQTNAIANRLNNIGLTDKPLATNIPFHDQITGANKALMGALNFASDIGHNAGAILSIGNVGGLSDIGYNLKKSADDLAERNQIPQNGELGNILAGQTLPMVLNMEALRRFSGGIGKPIYQALGKYTPVGRLGEFGEGVVGGLAVSPANSFLISRQYYDSQIKAGEDPANAAAKADQLFTKNLATDMVFTPLQMGLMKLPASGGWGKKALTLGAEGLSSGANFTLQDFNQKSTDNPALHIIDYLSQDPYAKTTFLQGAVLGMLQKGAVDAMKDWDVRSNTKRMFDFDRQFGTDKRTSLPSNSTIANNVLAAIEMKNVPGRAEELKNLVSELGNSGTYSKEEVKRIHDIIDYVNTVKGQVPRYGTQFQKLAVFNELLNQQAAKEHVANSGNKAAAKNPEEAIKESNERIQRIMQNKEPLYFINGNETNKEQLRQFLEENPDLINSPGVRIDIRNDHAMTEELKNKANAIQKQSAAAADVRTAPGDSEKMVGRDEGEGAVNQETPGEEKTAAGPGVNYILEARHSITEHDEQGIASGQNQLPLSDEGVVKAHELKEEVAQHHEINKIVSSDLNRAKETAEIVADDKIPVETRPELRSWDLKDFHGWKDDELKPVIKWFADHPDATSYEGDIEAAKGKSLGESLNTYANRAIEARKEVEKEGPGTMLISHSNNMNIWDAYKANGDKWDENAIKDFVNRPTPEPAEIKPTEEDIGKQKATNEKIESGEIPKKELTNTAKLFIEYEEGNEPTFPEVHPADASGTGGNEADEASRQFAKNTGPQKYVPPSGQQTAATGQNTGTQPVSAGASAPDPAQLTRNAKMLILSGRTDEQILTYLQRKGMTLPEAKAALGAAKADPLRPAQKIAAQAEVTRQFFGKEDDWLGRKDLNKINSQLEARKFQDAIKESVKNDPAQKGTDWKDVDKAIHIYLDTQRNPQHFQQYYNKLSPEQKKIADLSQKLNPAQLKVADDIRKQYDQLGQQAKHEELIRDVLDNYVGRAWDLSNGRPATEQNFKFNTSSKHQLQRSLETVLQGYAEGMKLKIEGASNNLQVLKQEIGNVIENKRLLDQGLNMKYDSGETNAKGKPIMKPLFTTKTDEPGYQRINNRGFRKWEYAGKLKDYSQNDIETSGNDTLVTEDGTVLKKKDVYAPADVAKSLNNIMGQSAGSSSNFIQNMRMFNAAVKQSILSYSGFHFIAFTRAHELSTQFTEAKQVNPIYAYKTGLNMLAEQHPIGQELIRQGMTISRQQDWMEGVNQTNTKLGKLLDQNSWTKAAKDKLIDLNTSFHHYLFNQYGAGLKMFDGINMIKQEMQKNPNQDQRALYQRVAKLMNDTYGGINWDRMHGSQMQNPTNRQLASMLLLAPDWTASNLRMAKKAFERGDEGQLYRKAWGRVILRGLMVTTAANAIMSFWDNTDKDGNPVSWSDAMADRYGKAWNAGKLRWSMIDITPLYHAIGGADDKRAYFSIFGAYTDPMKMVAHPVDYLNSKGSYITKLPVQAFTGQNWQGKEFTTLDELLGMDDKGTYTKTTTSHEKGDINPDTGELYKRTQIGHEEGEAKGGKLTTQLTKWPTGGGHPITWMQTPSFILNQVRGMMPTAVQNIWQVMNGENDATTGILNAVGSGVLVNKEPKENNP